MSAAHHRFGPALLSGLDYKWRALIAVAIGTFMATLDSSIVNVALPTLSATLHADIPTVGWVVTAYLLTLTGLLLSMGRLSDLLGHKRVYNGGFLVFTLGSLLCAVSGSVGQLIAFRVVQAVGAAMLAANGAAILTSGFPRSERGQAMGINGTIVASGLTVGPALGGLLIHSLGWRSIFVINLPIGVVGTLLAGSLLRADPPAAHRERFDGPGALALLLGLTGFLLVLYQGREWGWAATPTLVLFLAASLFLALFLVIELRTPHPTMDLSLFRSRLFAAGNVSAVISYVAIATTTFVMPFYLQRIRGYETREVGLMLMVVPLTMLVVSPASGWLSDRIGSRSLSSAGMGCIALGMALLSRLDPATPPLGIAGRLFLIGLGNGLFTSPNSSAIMGAVPPQRLGVASGMIATVRSMGMAIGVAVAGTVIAARTADLAGAGLARIPALQGALDSAFVVGAAIALAGILPSLVRGREERRAAPAVKPPSQP